MKRIPGGISAYRNAVHEAYTEPMHNPCVRWSLRDGFRAESALTPADSDQYTVGTANYSANTGERWLPETRSAYREVRLEIIAFQAALDAGSSPDDAQRAAADAAFDCAMAREIV